MHPIPSECPICGGDLSITRLECGECETKIEGRFISGPFAHLSNEQLSFVELFVKNEGKIKHVEAEMGLSYPTIRNRLNEIIKAMGYDLGKEDEGITEDERRQILEDLNQGKITSDEAAKMLKE